MPSTSSSINAQQSTGRPVFHDLTIASIDALGNNAIAVRFAIPDDLRPHYAFVPGQYLTLRAVVDGADIRRSYSICTAPFDDHIGVGIKLVEGGAFSGHAMAHFAVGDVISVMTPQGRFTYDDDVNDSVNDAVTDSVNDEDDADILLLAAGSGITPILSIARTALQNSTSRKVTLVYGNRDSASIMFRAAVEDLKDRFMDRLRLVHILSREQRDIDLLNGRVDASKIEALITSGMIAPARLKAAYICGPDSMIADCTNALEKNGVPADRINFERFTPAGGATPRKAPARVDETLNKHKVEVRLDGAVQTFTIDPAAETLLAAGQRAGLEFPYSCAAGMCCTCRCKLVEGDVAMDVNFSLEEWEIEAGFILSCQARPKSPSVIIDFDAQ